MLFVLSSSPNIRRVDIVDVALDTVAVPTDFIRLLLLMVGQQCVPGNRLLLLVLCDEIELRVFNETDRSCFPDDDNSGSMLYCITNTIGCLVEGENIRLW